MMTSSLKEAFEEGNSNKIAASFTSTRSAVGHIFKVDAARIVPRQSELDVVYETDTGISSQKQAFSDARQHTKGLYEKYLKHAKEHAAFEVRDIVVQSLQAELGMVQSGSDERGVLKKIDDGQSAQRAVHEYFEAKINFLLAQDNENQRKMAVEIAQQCAALQHYLADKPYKTLHDLKAGSILVTESLKLSDLAYFLGPKTGKTLIEGIIVDEGSMQSHALILARAMGIPCASVSQAQYTRLKSGTEITMKGASDGEGFINLFPSEDEKEACRAVKQARTEQDQWLQEKWGDESKSQMPNGDAFSVHANFGMSYESPLLFDAHPRAIGLYRTELYMEARSNGVTSVDDHLNIIRENMKLYGESFDNPDHLTAMTVRTIDLAGDKSDLSIGERKAKELKITKDQMKALVLLRQELREQDQKHNPDDNKFERKLKAMVPNITDKEHFEKMQALMDEAVREVSEEKGQSFEPIKLGMMVENPGVFDDLDNIDAAFFSVGTNDLWHSLYNVDRYDDQSNDEYDPTKNAFLKRLQEVVRAGAEKNIPVSLCGNMASEVQYLPLLVGCGFRNLSAGAAQVNMLKELVSRIDVDAAQQLVEDMKQMTVREDRERLLADFNRKNLGLQPNGSLDMDGFETQTPSQIAAMDDGGEQDIEVAPQ